jgi:hypothetical protein
MTCVTLSKKKKCKINSCGLPDLQLTLSGIKMNSEVPVVCQKYKSLSSVKFHYSMPKIQITFFSQISLKKIDKSIPLSAR